MGVERRNIAERSAVVRQVINSIVQNPSVTLSDSRTAVLAGRADGSRAANPAAAGLVGPDPRSAAGSVGARHLAWGSAGMVLNGIG